MEFLASTVILLVMSAAAFSVMADIQREASYQSEVQGVLANARIAAETVQRYIKQAGNNPRGAVLEGVTIVSAHEVHLQADLTGSAPANPNRGDPDGDINDLDEDVALRHNAGSRTLEIVLPDGTVRTAAGFITAFSMQYLDQTGASTAVGADVQRIRVTLTAGSQLAHPKTGQRYALTQTLDLQLVSR